MKWFCRLLIVSLFVVLPLSASAQGQISRPNNPDLHKKTQTQARLTPKQMYDKAEKCASDADAIKWHQKAAEQGYAPSQAKMAYYYDNGYSVPQDKATAFKWFLKAAEQGDGWSQYQVAERYRNGIGVVKNPSEAVRWYTAAASNSEKYAMTQLAMMYYKGDGISRDYAQAFKMFDYAATHDNSYDAKFYLAWMYEHGQGVEANTGYAVIWYNEVIREGGGWTKAATEALQRLK